MTEPKNLKQTLDTARRYLFILEEQAAAFGLYPPRHILIEIQDITTIIAELQTLAETPFYLNPLLTYFISTDEIPPNPARLLDYSVDMALNEEIAKGLLKAEEKEELIEQLSLLAFNMSDDGVKSTNPAQAAGWLFHLRDKQLSSFWKKYCNITDGIEPEATSTEPQQATAKLKQAQACGLITIQNGELKIAHQWLQQYFCALFLLKQPLNKEWLDRVIILLFEEFWPMWAGMDNTLVDRLLDWLQASANKEHHIIVALGKIGDPRAVEPLIHTLKVDDPDVGFAAAEALGRIGDTRAIPELERMILEHESNLEWFWPKIIATSAVRQIKVRQTKTPPP